MIAVDTSALMAMVLNEPQAETCSTALEGEDDLLISAGTVAETRTSPLSSKLMKPRSNSRSASGVNRKRLTSGQISGVSGEVNR